jgi:hypothetical protein
LPFVLLTGALDLHTSDNDTIALIKEIEGWALLYEKTHGVRLELVVIDTLAAATPGANENASEDMSRVLARCARISSQCRCHVMLVHHMNAAGSKPRGHSSLFANIDNAIEITMSDRTESGGYRADGSEIRRKVRTAKLTKQKDGECDLSWDFTLKQVVLGRDMDGEPITSCVAVPVHGEADVAVAGKHSEQTSGPKAFRLTNQEGLIFRCILDAINEFGEAAPRHLQLPASVSRVVSYEHVKSLLKRRMPLEEDDTEEGRKRHQDKLRTALKRARETLTKFQVIGVDNPYVWHTGKPVHGFPQTYAKDRKPKDTEPLGPPGDDINDLVPDFR